MTDPGKNRCLPDSKAMNGDFRESILHDDNTLRLLRIVIGLVISGCLIYLAAISLSIENAVIRGPGLVVMSGCAVAAWRAGCYRLVAQSRSASSAF